MKTDQGQLERCIEELETENESLEEENWSIGVEHAKAVEALRQADLAMGAQCSRHERALRVRDAHAAHLEVELERLQCELDASRQEVSALNLSVEPMREHVQRLEATIEEARVKECERRGEDPYAGYEEEYAADVAHIEREERKRAKRAPQPPVNVGGDNGVA